MSLDTTYKLLAAKADAGQEFSIKLAPKCRAKPQIILEWPTGERIVLFLNEADIRTLFKWCKSYLGFEIVQH